LLPRISREFIILIKYFIFDITYGIKMNTDDDDDNYPGKLLHQAALYLNVDLLKVILNQIFFLLTFFFFLIDRIF
jgi:hypothetical protein